MKKEICFFLMYMSLLSGLVQAEQVSNATITTLMVDRQLGNKVFIKLSSSQSTRITCHSNYMWDMVLDTSDSLGKELYSGLLTLYASGKAANFTGTNDCSVYHNVEALRRVELK